MDSIQAKKGNLTYEVNYLIELLSVIQILSEDYNRFKDYYQLDNDYIERIRSYFSKYKDETIVEWYEKLIIDNHTFGNSHILKYKLEDGKLVLPKENYHPLLEECLPHFNSFIENTNFDQFFLDNSEYYELLLDEKVNMMRDSNIISKLSEYYDSNINVRLIVKQVQSDWGEFIDNKDGVYTIICGSTAKYEKRSDDSVLIIHEVSHQFAKDFICEHKNLFDNISVSKADFINKYYPDFNDYLEDLVVRAQTAYIKYKYNISNKMQYEDEIKMMKELGFDDIDRICNFLETSKTR